MTRMVHHLAALEGDLRELHQIARGWGQQSKGVQMLHQVEREFQQFNARAKTLMTEIGHMDMRRNQLAGGGPTSPTVGMPRPVAPPPPRPQESPPAVDAAEPPTTAGVMLPRESETDPSFLMVNHPPAPPASPPPTEPPSRIASVASGLPPHLLEELRRQGLK
jgi:hypothetical protein